MLGADLLEKLDEQHRKEHEAIDQEWELVKEHTELILRFFMSKRGDVVRVVSPNKEISNRIPNRPSNELIVRWNKCLRVAGVQVSQLIPQRHLLIYTEEAF